MIPTTMAPPQNENARRQPGIGQSKTTTNTFSYRSPSSVKGRTLGSLLRGARLTHFDCWKRFGSARLAHHVYKLRGISWPVQMLEQTVTTNDAGRPASIGVYYLGPEVIAAAGERGQQYAEECARVEIERRAA
jgi:hypothetical protein